MSVFEFHEKLRNDVAAYHRVKGFLSAPNSSSGTEITHAKALMILSVLKNKGVSKLERAKLVGKHGVMMSDVYYQPIFSHGLSNMP